MSQIITPGGMTRSANEGKVNYSLVRDGPMHSRWARHLTSGAKEYGTRNWMLARSLPELLRFEESAARHFEQWIAGKVDEDHASAVYFNINGAEYVKDQLRGYDLFLPSETELILIGSYPEEDFS